VRTAGSYREPVAGTSGVAAVYLNGAVVPLAVYSVSEGYAPAIVFTSPPPSGTTITADFSVLWLCRFSEDLVDFEEFMTMLFDLRTVTLQTVRP
jgi:hypothetical protein